MSGASPPPRQESSCPCCLTLVRHLWGVWSARQPVLWLRRWEDAGLEVARALSSGSACLTLPRCPGSSQFALVAQTWCSAVAGSAGGRGRWRWSCNTPGGVSVGATGRRGAGCTGGACGPVVSHCSGSQVGGSERGDSLGSSKGTSLLCDPAAI